jgi:hypothetical protein
MRSALPRVRELAERASSRTQVRLLWRQGTRQLWVEVREADDRVLADLGATGAGARCFPSPVRLRGYAPSPSPSRVARVL